MQRGPKPKPTNLKVLEGNPGHRPLNPDEPHPGGIPVCPSCLNAVAKREWTRLSRELLDIGVISSVDAGVLATYCEAYSNWVEACTALKDQRKKIGKSNMVVANKTGYAVVNPLLQVINAAADQMRKSGAELGLSPSSRSRLSAEPPKQKKIDEFTISKPDKFERPKPGTLIQ